MKLDHIATEVSLPEDMSITVKKQDDRIIIDSWGNARIYLTIEQASSLKLLLEALLKQKV